MLGFWSDELVWAIACERAEELRATRPHTERKPEDGRTVAPPRFWLWLDRALKVGSRPARGCA